MKKSSICIKLLIVAIIAIPIVIYFLANRIDRVQLEKVYEMAFGKIRFSQTSIKKETIIRHLCF